MPQIGMLGSGKDVVVLSVGALLDQSFQDEVRAVARRRGSKVYVPGLAAGIEPQVELWADPAASSNRHEIEATGAFCSLSIRTDNLPSPDNPAPW